MSHDEVHPDKSVVAQRKRGVPRGAFRRRRRDIVDDPRMDGEGGQTPSHRSPPFWEAQGSVVSGRVC
jgi:hypothetical protein